MAIASPGEPHALEKTCRDAVTLNQRRDRSAFVDEREDVGVRMEFAEHFEHALASAHAGEPVVDDGGSHPFFLGSGVEASGYSSFAAHASQM